MLKDIHSTGETALPLRGELRKEVTAFVESQRSGHYLQLPAWLDVGELCGARVFLSRNAEGDILASSILGGRRIRWPRGVIAEIPRGPVAADANVLAAHLTAVTEMLSTRYSSLQVNPFVSGADAMDAAARLAAIGFRPAGSGRFYDHTLLLPVQRSSAEQWRRLRRSTRTSINKARKAGLSVRLETESGAYLAFAERFSRFARRRGLPALGRDAAAGIQRAFAGTEPPSALLHSAVLGGAVVGQTLLMRNRNTLIYEWGWTAAPSERRNLPIMHPLLWEALALARASGFEALDLGGYWAQRPATGSTNQFKRGFGKEQRAYCGVFEYVCAPAAHTVYRLASQLKSKITRAD